MKLNDREIMLEVLDELKVAYSDYYRPDGRCDIQIYNDESMVIGVIVFDADGNFESCNQCV